MTMQVQMDAPKPANANGVFREEALLHHAGDNKPGDILKIDQTWVRWSYKIVLFAALAAFLYSLFGTVHEYASGPAVVRVEGRRVLTATFPATVQTLDVQPGQHVAAGQPLVHFYAVEEDAQFERAEKEFDSNLVRLLRDPNDSIAKQQLAGLKPQVDLAKTVSDERILRAPIAGVVSDIRVRAGQRLQPGEFVLAVAPENGEITVVAMVPGDYRPMLEKGLDMRFSLDGFKYEYHDLEVVEVGEEVVGPMEVRRFLGQELADAVTLTGPSVLVRAKIPQKTFQSEGAGYGYYDGLTGLGEVRVRSEPIIVMLIPALKSVTSHE